MAVTKYRNNKSSCSFISNLLPKTSSHVTVRGEEYTGPTSLQNSAIHQNMSPSSISIFEFNHVREKKRLFKILLKKRVYVYEKNT